MIQETKLTQIIKAMRHFTILFMLTLLSVSMNAADVFRQDSIYERVYQNLFTGSVNVNDPNDYCDLHGLDEGTSNFMRQLFTFEELTSDEAYCSWGDYGISDANANKVSALSPMLYGLWMRIYKGIDLCNYFLEQTATLTDAATLTQRASVRAMRALYYYHALDLFGNPPLTTSTTDKGQQVGREALFNFLIDELKAVEPDVPDAQASTSADAGYGYVNKGVVWMLLARLYLNAEVYTGTAHWAEAAAYAKKIIDCNAYHLSTTTVNGWSGYQQLFMGDNGESDAAKEMILPIRLDGNGPTGWGVMFYIAAMSNNREYINPDGVTMGNGSSQAWGGYSSRKPLIERFFPGGNVPNAHVYQMPAKAEDDRALIENSPKKDEDYNETYFGDSPYLVKFNNFHSDGSAGHNTTFADTDIPLMRYAEALMTYAEAMYRMGDTSTALHYINMVRTRAHAKPLTSLTLSDLTDEWSREFYYEARRRTDMIRFNILKGKSFRRLLPIPENVINNQPDLVQNPGYKVTDATDVKFIQPSFAHETITVDSIVALSFAWHSITQEEADIHYTLSIGKDRHNSLPFTSEDTTTTISAKDLQSAMEQYFPNLTEADMKVYCTAYCGSEEYSTDSMTIHVFASEKLNLPIKDPWYIIGTCIGDGSWQNSVEGVGHSMYPLDYRDNIIYFQAGDQFKLVKGFGWDNQWGSWSGNYQDLTRNDGASNNITIPDAGWYNIDMSNDWPSITPLTDYKETVYNNVSLTAGSQTFTLKPISNKEHEVEYFAQVTIDNKSKISINADDTILVKDATVKAGTYNVFVNTQSLNYSVSNADGYNEDDAKNNIVSTLESIPATSVGVIGLGRDDDSVQVVNIGRINPTDEVHNIVLVIGNKEIALTDDGKCTFRDIAGITAARVRFYAEYKSGDVTTRRWSDYFDLSTKVVPLATMVNSDGKRYGMAGDNEIIGYGYLSGSVTVEYGDLSWTQTVSEPGFYRGSFVVGSNDNTAPTLQLTLIKTISMIGSFNTWAEDVPMTYNATSNCWEGTLKLTEPTEMKFRANNDWGLDWGSNNNDEWSGTLTEMGNNISINTPDTYNVKVYLTYPYDSHYILTSATGITLPAAANGIEKIYDLNGVEMKHPKSGVYIVRKNGQTRKMIIK